MNPLVYHTRDLYLAAFLLASGYPLDEVPHDGDGRCTFLFRDRPERKDLVVGFYDGTASVSALAFAEGLRTLKSRVHR